MHRKASMLCMLAALLSFGSVAFAQEQRGSLEGTVRDAQGAVLPGVEITAMQIDTGGMRTTVSNETGSFVFAAVQPGRYTVRIEMQGFSAIERKNLTLPVNERLALGTIPMSVGGVSETITTTAKGSFA